MSSLNGSHSCLDRPPAGEQNACRPAVPSAALLQDPPRAAGGHGQQPASRKGVSVKKQIVRVCLLYALGIALLAYLFYKNQDSISQAFAKEPHFGPFLLA